MAEPNSIRSRFRHLVGKVRIGWMEFALAISILSLLGQLCWPAFDDWRKLPAPGAFGIVRLPLFSVGKSERAGINPCYVVRLPQKYGSASGPWPLIVFLHGSRQRGDDIQQLSSYLQTQHFKFLKVGRDLPAILAAPQCLSQHGWDPDAVVDFVDEICTRFRVDRHRVYLVGVSMGGYGVWHTAAAYPNLFAAAVPICGGGDPKSADSLVAIPIWAFHGSLDDVVPLDQSKQMVDAVRHSGGSPRFSILQGAGHGIGNQVCGREDVWEWLLEQSLGANPVD